MPGRGGGSRAQRRLQHENQTSANDMAASHSGYGRWNSHPRGGRANNRASGRNSISQTNRLNHNSTHLLSSHRRNSTANTVHNRRPYTAPSRLNDGSRVLFRDIHNPKYHNRIRALISEGSLLSQKLQEFLKDIEFVLKSDPEEMDWDHTSQKEVVSDATSKEEWQDIKPEAKNPFNRLTLQTPRTTLTMRERRDESQGETGAGHGVEEPESPVEGVAS
ncbi:hypothetical protein MMC15_006488 [Xylographa vitiligo]|nr:hypothetical protein [Xylographa vitiligo]